jgi:hypothetical protein
MQAPIDKLADMFRKFPNDDDDDKARSCRGDDALRR